MTLIALGYMLGALFAAAGLTMSVVVARFGVLHPSPAYTAWPWRVWSGFLACLYFTAACTLIGMMVFGVGT